MAKNYEHVKESVRKRSGGCCERCGVKLTWNVHGVPDGDSARSLHHRQPRRCGGKDSIFNLVNLCIRCHREVHEDEKTAALDGWIVIGRFPGNTPFRGHQGWVLPHRDGSLTLLDFDLGRAVNISPPPRTRVPTRSRRGHRKARKRSTRRA